MPSQSYMYSNSNSNYYSERSGGSNAGCTTGQVTLDVTVSGSNIVCTVTANLDLDWNDGTPSGRPYLALYDVDTGGSSRRSASGYGSNPYRQVRTISDVADGDDIIGTWSTTFRAEESSGDILLNVEPGSPYTDSHYDQVRVHYTGATPYVEPNGSVSLPAALVAGQNVAVSCSMSGGEGSLTGTLKRYYKAASASTFTATTIRNNITGSNTTVTDTLPSTYGGGKVYYELTVSDGTTSRQVQSATKDVLTNSAPSTPSSLTVPSTIGGGQTVTISWGSSTDPDGNLSGYQLEHSTDGGVTWQQVYQGTALTTTETVIAGTERIRWRVRAYDNYGVTSSWRTSSDVTVINNQPPTVPASPITITPSALSVGMAAVITWGASSDPDGDNFEYSLERSVDNTTSYQQIYRGTNRNYTDTVGSWSSVTYRVRAIDSHGNASGYLTASTKSVSANNPPTITCSYEDGADLGTKSAVFSFTYSVNDSNSADTLTVKEFVDGVEKKSFTATRNQNYTFNFQTGSNVSYWQNVLNGSHTIKISVTDGKVTVSRSFTFLKSVDACLITLKTPISAATGKKVDTAIVSFCADVPEGGITSVQVCSNGDQASPTWEDCELASGDAGYAVSGIGGRKKKATKGVNEALLGGNYVYIHKMTNSGGKFNFRIQLSQVNGVGGWISSVQGTFTEASAT